jgi:hypothetical protein
MLTCRGYSHCTDCGYERDCGYPNTTFSCEDCIINGGKMSPQTGKVFRGNHKKYQELARDKYSNQEETIELDLSTKVWK